MKYSIVGILCALAVPALPLSAGAGQVLPDELTVNVGDVWGDARSATNGTPPVLTNATLVLTQRSIRSAHYVCGIWSDSGFKKVEFPVSTYRGQVQGDPALRVTANIQPGGLLSAHISAGHEHIGNIEKLKIDVPDGKCTPTSSTGNKVVPLKSLPTRKLPTPSGCLLPKVPMRRMLWVVTAPATYTAHSDYETVVSRVEGRWSDGDYVFARDVGTAWEIDVLILMDPKSTTPVDWAKVFPGDPDRIKGHLYGNVTGVPGRNNGKRNSLSVCGDMTFACILLHEGGHIQGNWCHQVEAGGLCGGLAFFERNSVHVFFAVQETPGMECYRGEDEFPGVIYNGALPPSAMRDIYSTRKDTPAGFDVLENDYDGNGDDFFLQAVTPTSEKGGTVAVAADKRKAWYTPPAGFVGLDTFTYTVMDSTGAANKSGFVKVDVRPEGLAFYCGFEEPQKDTVEWLVKKNDWRSWAYDLIKTPESGRSIYHFAASGPYAAEPAHALWINYVPVNGVRGKGLLNPVGGYGAAQVDLSNAGDPGRESLSASVWVLFQQTAGGLILGKICDGGKTLSSGWKISASPSGFSFSGRTVRLFNEDFEVHSEEPVQSNKWYHLVIVMDRKAGKVRGYVNNKEVTASSSSPNIPDAVIEYTGPLRLFNGGTGFKSWCAQPMLVDEVKIFTEALAPKQVGELYAEGKDAKVPDLKDVPVAKDK